MGSQRVLIYGNGFVASLLQDCERPDYDVRVSTANVLDELAVEADLEEYAPDVVINTAAKTNIDWCESHRDTTFKVNVLGSDTLAKLCAQRDIYFVHFSSGCLQESAHASDIKHEADAINPLCFYAWTKAWAEHLIADRCQREGLRALLLRPRLLLSAKLSNRNSILKLMTYSRFVDIAQSATIAEDMVAAVWRLIEQRAEGPYNIANPGLISPWEIAQMVKETIDPDFEPVKIGVEELNSFTRVKRIRSVLSTDRLREQDIELPEIKPGLRRILLNLRGQILTQHGRQVMEVTQRDTEAKLKQQALP